MPKGAKASGERATKTLIEGKGATVNKGDFVRLDYAAQAMKTGQNLGSSWTQQPGTDTKAPRRQVIGEVSDQAQSMLPPKVLGAVAGQKVGSRVQVEGTAKELVGENLNPQLGIKPEDGLVWVVDIAAATKADKKAKAEGEQAKPEEGMPEVKAEGDKAATITIQGGEGAHRAQGAGAGQGQGPEGQGR